MNFLIQAILKSFKRHFDVIMGLEVEPELRFHVEKTPQAECRVSGNRTPSMYDFVYTSWRHSNILCQAILSDLHWL